VKQRDQRRSVKAVAAQRTGGSWFFTSARRQNRSWLVVRDGRRRVANGPTVTISNCAIHSKKRENVENEKMRKNKKIKKHERKPYLDVFGLLADVFL